MAKKILIFSTAYLPLVGGAEIAVKELTDRLANPLGKGGRAFGWNFDLITARLKKDLPKQERIVQITVYRLGSGRFLDKFLLPFFGLLKALALNRKNNYAIIWSIMASQASIAAAFLKIFFPKKKLILNLQEGDEESHLTRYVKGNIFLYKFFVRPGHLLVFKKADLITAISADLKARAEKNGVKAAILVIPNGVNLQRFKRPEAVKNKELKNKLGWAEADKIIITISRLVKKNGVGDLIEAMRYLPAEVKLLIIGGGELKESLESKISSLPGGEARIKMAGAIKNEAIPGYLALADIFVRPSLSEGLGISFLEAMAADVPVIGTAVGGIVDFLKDGETGLFCQAGNPKSIAEKIKACLENKELAAKIRQQAGRLVAKNYDWDLIAKKTKEIFEKIIV